MARTRKQQLTILQIAMTGLMAALVFVSSMIQIPIPLPVGNTRLHLGNVFCLLAGFLLGALRGGLAAGLGSFFFDLLNPQYLPSSPFTFVFKFTMAFVCALISHAGGRRADHVKLNFVAAASGSLAYMILYLGKGFVENLLLRMEIAPALAILWTKFTVSGVNAIIAVIVSVPLCLVIKKALKTSRLLEMLE